MTRVAILTAHAPWTPHCSGWGGDKGLNENRVSTAVSIALAHRLQDLYIDAQVFEQPERYQCTQPCATASRRGHHDNGLCADYNHGLEWQVEKAREFDLALSFHVDHSVVPGREGPMCLYVGGPPARGWALDWLEQLEATTHHRRRGRAPANGIRWNGAFNYSRELVAQAYGRKAILQRGCARTVVIEMGVVESQRDRDWLNSQAGVDQVVAATVVATRRFFGLVQ